MRFRFLGVLHVVAVAWFIPSLLVLTCVCVCIALVGCCAHVRVALHAVHRWLFVFGASWCFQILSDVALERGSWWFWLSSLAVTLAAYMSLASAVSDVVSSLAVRPAPCSFMELARDGRRVQVCGLVVGCGGGSSEWRMWYGSVPLWVVRLRYEMQGTSSHRSFLCLRRSACQASCLRGAAVQYRAAARVYRRVDSSFMVDLMTRTLVTDEAFLKALCALRGLRDARLRRYSAGFFVRSY